MNERDVMRCTGERASCHASRVPRRTDGAGHEPRRAGVGPRRGTPRAAALCAPRRAAPGLTARHGREPGHARLHGTRAGRPRVRQGGPRRGSARGPRAMEPLGPRAMAGPRAARSKQSAPGQGGVARSLEGRTTPGQGSPRGDGGARTRPQPCQAAPRAGASRHTAPQRTLRGEGLRPG
jgi:hypothetical protein